jgi:hypothetical protein
MVEAREFGDARSSVDPELEQLLLDNGYYANIIRVADGRRGLRASQRSYTNSVWTRDLDYAISGYSYALGDMTVLRENIELFLMRVSADGIAPETIYIWGNQVVHENRQAWDSLPNLIRAVYVYVSKTGDFDFYLANRETVLRIGERIAAMDQDGDMLPDGENFPYGYYDSLAKTEMHTYAIARFYGAYSELAELEAIVGADGSGWRERARLLRAAFHRPLTAGGYWQEEQSWPIAWHRSDGSYVNILETYSVFAALQNGLIGREDGQRYQLLLQTLSEFLPEMLIGPSPLRLALGGYEPEMRRVVDPPVPLWMLDASAPWVVGQAVPAFTAAGERDAARQVLAAYNDMARRTNPPVLEFAAGDNARYGSGNSGDGGRTWDSAAWFLAVYRGHYGLEMTPLALVIEPHPFLKLPAATVSTLSYQGALIQFELNAANNGYRLNVDRPINAILRPVANAPRLSLNGDAPAAELALRLEPGITYQVLSLPD